MRITFVITIITLCAVILASVVGELSTDDGSLLTAVLGAVLTLGGVGAVLVDIGRRGSRTEDER